MKHLVLYDDQCPLCIFQMKMLTWLDWFHVSQLVPLSSPQARQAAPQIDPETLQAALHVVTNKGQILRGARGIRFLALRMPLLVLLGLFLWVPGVILLAEIVYNFIARHRRSLSRLFGCKDACALLPSRKRSGDQLVK